MAICCFPNCAYLSETSRMVSVYKKLIEKGEKVLLATHGGTYEFVFNEEGIPYHHIEPHVSSERSLDFAASSRMERGHRDFYNTDELRDHVQSEMNFFKEKGVSAVLSGWCLSNALSTRALGIPYAVTHIGSWVPPTFERKLQPWPLGYENLFTRLIPTAWKIGLVNFSAPRIKGFIRSPNIIAKELNIPSFKSFLDLSLGDLTLITDCPEILSIPEDEINHWTSENPRLYSRKIRLRYVGAIFAELFGELSDEIKVFLNTEKPKIYVALTSSRLDYLESVYSVIKHMDAKIIFCTTIHPSNFKQSDRILIINHLPAHKVMPLVDLAIIHGGQGSVQTAIASGTPCLGFPFHPEQDFNLNLVEKQGGGLRLSLKSLKRGGF